MLKLVLVVFVCTYYKLQTFLKFVFVISNYGHWHFARGYGFVVGLGCYSLFWATCEYDVELGFVTKNPGSHPYGSYQRRMMLYHTLVTCSQSPPYTRAQHSYIHKKSLLILNPMAITLGINLNTNSIFVSQNEMHVWLTLWVPFNLTYRGWKTKV